jgi:hypothetical protein
MLWSVWTEFDLIPYVPHRPLDNNKLTQRQHDDEGMEPAERCMASMVDEVSDLRPLGPLTIPQPPLVLPYSSHCQTVGP